jgi:hypothetical protein
MKQSKSQKRLNADYTRQLGMSPGSATHKLTRNLLFRYIQQNHDDVCYRCGSKIETLASFSIEHKEPWRNSDPNLFWDLENISFAHKKCNIQAAQHIGKRVIGPPGTSWCSNHKMFFPVDRFYKNRSMWNGLHRQCKECHKNWKKAYRSTKFSVL